MKIAKLLTLLVILTAMTMPAMAGIDWKPIDVGNISCAIWNTAVVGFPQDPTANPSGWWPAGTNDSYIYEGDIWIGARKAGKIGVSESDGRSSEFWPTDDVPEIISKKPGVTSKDTPTSQSMYLKCTDTNDAVNDNPLGLEMEINVFQWSYAPLYDFFILEHKVKNVGDSDLEGVYMAFRYDIDVSSNETGTANYSGDDFIALDETPDGLNPEVHPSRNMSYGYSNASAPGYIGIRVLDAYIGDDPKAEGKKIPFTAHKRITIDTDPTTDEERYALISVPGVDPLPANYDDQRYVQSYGPIEKFAPDDEFTVVLVVAIGKGLDGLRASADWAQKLYDDDYIAPAPPPSPRLRAYPGDGKVNLVWDAVLKTDEGEINVEEYVDLTDEEKVFEGYRVYRREVSYDPTTGIPSEGWTQIAEFDKLGDTGNFFTVSHVGKKSDATIANEGTEPYFADFFKSSMYIIKFTSSTTFEVVNTTLWEVMEYNDTLEDGVGYAVIKDMETGEPYPDGTYRPGEAIYFGGLYVSISGSPVAGDIFQVVSTPSMAIGEDTGIQHHFVDENLMPGIRYAYAVTSYDTGNPKTGLISMESSKIDTTVYIYPRSNPAGYEKPESLIEHTVKDPTAGPLSDGEVTAEPIEPENVTGDTYEVTFDEETSEWTLTDKTIGSVVFENQPQSDETVIVDGLLLVVNGPSPNMTGKEMSGGSGAGSIDFEQAYMGGRNANHHDFEIRFVDSMQQGIVREQRAAMDSVPFELWDIGYGTPDDPSDDIRVWPLFYDYSTADDIWTAGEGAADMIVFTSIPYDEDFFANPDHDPDNGAYWGYDPADPMSRHDWLYRMLFAEPPEPGDVWRFISTKPNTSNDVFTIATKAELIPEKGDEKILDKIKVVPNPYFVTNKSVTQEGTDQIFFTHLPAKCTIRIYTLAGEFVREIEHDGLTSPFPDDPFVQGSAGGTESFDLLTYNQQALASGVYIYHVDAGDI